MTKANMTESTDNLVEEFHQAFGLPVFRSLRAPGVDRIRFRHRLIAEEFKEVQEELATLTKPVISVDEQEQSLTRLAKELADLRYVVDGMALEFGIDLPAVFKEVHRSNMSKLGEDGEIFYRWDGKILKGPNYTEADIASVLSYTIDVDGSHEAT